MKAIQSVRDKLGTSYEYRRVEVVGPTVGSELLRAGILATIPLRSAAISRFMSPCVSNGNSASPRSSPLFTTC